VLACVLSDLLLSILTRPFLSRQQQVELAVQAKMRRESAERAESKRIAELFPIEWHSDQSASSESPRSANKHSLSTIEEPVRTPSPVDNGGLIQNTSPESPREPIPNIARRYSPIRKSIFKTPALSFVKENLQAKAGSVKSNKSLRNHFTKQSQFQDLDLPQSSPTKCGMLSNQIQFPAPYGLS
jgi:hypothetical protein